jgi:hypothetical protein
VLLITVVRRLEKKNCKKGRETNISCEHRSKNPCLKKIPNIIQQLWPYPTLEFTLGVQVWFNIRKSIDANYGDNGLKKKNHIIISIDARKALEPGASGSRL